MQIVSDVGENSHRNSLPAFVFQWFPPKMCTCIFLNEENKFDWDERGKRTGLAEIYAAFTFYHHQFRPILTFLVESCQRHESVNYSSRQVECNQLINQ